MSSNESDLDRAGSAITHLPALDGFRGAAIVLVLAAHTSTHLYTIGRWHSVGGSFIFWTFGAGWAGVDLFFVLSGFLITRILLATSERPNFFKNFYARRVLRIWPLYLAFCVGLLILCLRYPSPGYRGDLVSLLLYYNNFKEALFSFHIFYALPCWSLAVEEQFYLVWPFVVLFAPRHLRTICVVGIALSFAARLFAVSHGLPEKAIYILTPCRLDALLVGAWLADAFRNPGTWAKVRHYRRSVLAVAAVGLAVVIGYEHGLFDWLLHVEHRAVPKYSQFGFAIVVFLVSLLFGGLLVETISGGWFSACMRWRWLRALGKVSYGMYLFHMIVDVQLAGLLLRFAPRIAGRWIVEPFFLVAVIVVTFACAFVSYHLYEQQFLKLKRRFSERSADA